MLQMESNLCIIIEKCVHELDYPNLDMYTHILSDNHHNTLYNTFILPFYQGCIWIFGN